MAVDKLKLFDVSNEIYDDYRYIFDNFTGVGLKEIKASKNKVSRRSKRLNKKLHNYVIKNIQAHQNYYKKHPFFDLDHFEDLERHHALSYDADDFLRWDKQSLYRRKYSHMSIRKFIKTI